MSAKVLTKAAAKEARIDVIEDGRGSQAVHDVVVAMRAARRSGSANKQTDARKVLLISDTFDQTTLKSGRNVKRVTLATASDVNTEQLLAFEKILVTQKALEQLADRTRSPRNHQTTE